MKNKLVPASGSSPDLGGLEPPVLGIIHHTEAAGLLTTDQEDVEILMLDAALGRFELPTFPQE